eukprot:1568388-Pyramimonas_sp.AAC.1
MLLVAPWVEPSAAETETVAHWMRPVSAAQEVTVHCGSVSNSVGDYTARTKSERHPERGRSQLLDGHAAPVGPPVEFPMGPRSA